MHVLFEDDGQLKAGTVLADHDQSLQVEAVSGKRLKIKAASVLLRFALPGPAEALGDALMARSKQLEEEHFHAQVKVSRESTLLFCDIDGRRVPIRDLVGTTPEVVSVDAQGHALVARVLEGERQHGARQVDVHRWYDALFHLVHLELRPALSARLGGPSIWDPMRLLRIAEKS